MNVIFILFLENKLDDTLHVTFLFFLKIIKVHDTMFICLNPDHRRGN